MYTDMLLLDAAKMMNREAITRIFDQYASPLYGYALHLCGDPLRADQIVGDVFAKFIEQLSAGKGPINNLRSYLYQITYHSVVDDVRLNWRNQAFESAQLTSSDGFSPQRNAEQGELLQNALRVILDDLTEDQRHVLFLRFMEGFSLKETARIIGKKVGNVKVIQNRALAALRKVLGDQEIVISSPAQVVGDDTQLGNSGKNAGIHPGLVSA